MSKWIIQRGDGYVFDIAQDPQGGFDYEGGRHRHGHPSPGGRCQGTGGGDAKGQTHETQGNSGMIGSFKDDLAAAQAASTPEEIHAVLTNVGERLLAASSGLGVDSAYQILQAVIDKGPVGSEVLTPRSPPDTAKVEGD